MGIRDCLMPNLPAPFDESAKEAFVFSATRVRRFEFYDEVGAGRDLANGFVNNL